MNRNGGIREKWLNSNSTFLWQDQYLDKDRGRKGIKVEKFDGFCNAVFNSPPTSIVADK
jgi:predicted transposase YbfD/YdcC